MTEPINTKHLRQIVHDIRAQLGVVQTFLYLIEPQCHSREESDMRVGAALAIGRISSLCDELTASLKSCNEADGVAPSMAPMSRIDAGKTVLIIDDDHHVRTWIAEALRAKNITTITLTSGDELIKSALDFKNISSAIVGYHFENSSLDGFDIIEFLQMQNVGNIYLCTGQHDDPEVIRRAGELGVVSVIGKPLTQMDWNLFK